MGGEGYSQEARRIQGHWLVVNEEGALQNRREQAVSRGHMLEKLGRISRPLICAVQAAIFAVSGIGAFLLRFDLSIPAKETAHLAYALAVWIVVKSIAFRLARLDRGWWRFVSLDDLPRLAIGNLLGSFLGALAILWIAPRGFPRSIYVLDLVVCSLLTSGVRLAVRSLVEASKFRAPMEKKRILIYGAGEAGVALLTEIRHNPSLPYRVIGFIDDNPQKVGQAIHGAKVLGDGGSLTAVVGKHRVDTVLIAIPSASGIADDTDSASLPAGRSLVQDGAKPRRGNQRERLG